MGNLLAKLRWKRTDGRPASEQPTEDEGTRRDIPEKEYERPSPEQTKEAVPKDENIPGKVSESTTNSNLTQETKFKENEKSKPSSPVEQKDTTESALSSNLVQEAQPSQIKVAKPSSVEEQKEISISKVENIQVNIDEEPEISVSKEKETENESENLEEAVVKIQAGIRGYLTRKTLKEQRDSVSPCKSPNIEEEGKDDISKFEIEVKEEKADEHPILLSKEVILEPSSVQEISADTNDGDIEKAAVKIQSVYRGYITRKNLSNIGDDFIEESEATDETKEKSTEVSYSEKESVPLSTQNEELEEENEDGALEQAAVKIQSTFRGYQVRKQRKNGPKKEDAKEQLLIDTNEFQDENEKAEISDSEAEGKAAVKIQAMYRGYKVRKEIKMIGEDGDEIIETIENENSKHGETDYDKSNTFSNENDPDLKEYSEEAQEDGILKSKTTIVFSTPADDKSSKVTKEEVKEDVLINFNTDIVPPTAEPISLLDENNKEQCFQKPMVPVSNEATIPKSISEPTVDLNSVIKTKDDQLLSPSSD